jgi:hypothetical protein
MLRSLRDLLRYDVDASDGACGTVRDFYFDDAAWCVRYLVIDTHKWLPGETILLSPACIRELHADSHRIAFELSRHDIEQRPHVPVELPIPREDEKRLSDYYQWPVYWSASPGRPPMPAATGQAGIQPTGPMTGATAGGLPPTGPRPRPTGASGAGGPAATLRSFATFEGMTVQATDDVIGRLHDLIVDSECWEVRYGVVETGGVLHHRTVLLALGWVQHIDWTGRTLAVDLTAGQVEGSPEFDPAEPVNRDDERRLYDYYGRPRDREAS